MLDQPTQPYYRVTVTGLFQLMHQVVTELAPRFQIIVSDHADLPHPWYQDSVRYNWRDGEKLIPTTWLDTNPTP